MEAPVTTLEGSRNERLRAALAPIQRVHGEFYAAFTLAGTQGRWFHDRIVCVGDRERVMAWEGATGTPFEGGFPVDNPSPNQTNRFSGAGLERVAREQTAVYRSRYQPLGVHHQRRMLVYEGTRFLAWVGVMRADPTATFSAEEDRRLLQVTEEVRRRVRAQAAAGDLGLSGGGLAAIVLRADGSVEYASEPARRWLTRERAATLRDAVRRAEAAGTLDLSAIDSVLTSFTRLHGNDGGTRYLVTLSAAEAPESGGVRALSPRGREVAECLAAGATIEEVARHLGIKANTVREHRDRVYRTLGVSCRAELVGALRG